MKKENEQVKNENVVGLEANRDKMQNEIEGGGNSAREKSLEALALVLAVPCAAVVGAGYAAGGVTYLSLFGPQITTVKALNATEEFKKDLKAGKERRKLGANKEITSTDALAVRAKMLNKTSQNKEISRNK